MTEHPFPDWEELTDQEHNPPPQDSAAAQNVSGEAREIPEIPEIVPDGNLPGCSGELQSDSQTLDMGVPDDIGSDVFESDDVERNDPGSDGLESDDASETETFDYSQYSGTDDIPADFLAEAEADIRTDDSQTEDDYREFDDVEFQKLLRSEPEVEQDSASKRAKPVRKGRPKRKKGEGFLGIPNLLVTVVWAAIVLAVGVTLGRMAWICATEVLAFGRENKSVTITVYETDTIDDITQKLYDGGLIHYPGLFKLYARFAVDEGEIHAGIWDLNTLYDYHAIVKMMSPSSSREVVTLTIPEGYTCRQIFSLMEESKVCTALDLGSYAASGELKDYWFLEDVERGNIYSLEGYLFPDTYEFYKNDSPKNILEKMLDNFDTRFTQEMRDQLPVLNEYLSDLMRDDGRDEAYIADHQLTVKDLVIVASMIEKETSGNKESPTIASVIYNRLFHWGSTPAYLNIDASIIYAWGGKTDLTAEDLKIDSPYNTYYNTGLTPTPISNPGLASLQAALNPEDTDYYYYVLDTAAGTHVFSKTLEEHEANRAALSNAGN